MSYNPDLENLLEILKKEDAKKEILESEDNINNLLYFVKEEQIEAFFKGIASNYEESNEYNKKYENIIKNITQFYPLTEKIIDKIINHAKNKELEYIAKGYDITGNLIKGITFFLSNMKNKKDKQCTSIEELNEKKEKYNKERKEVEEKETEIRETGAENKELYNKVEKLKKDVKELKNSYTEEALSNKKIELEQEKTKLNKKKKEMGDIQKEIEKIALEIKNIEDYNDDGAFENFKNFTKSLIKNEE